MLRPFLLITILSISTFCVAQKGKETNKDDFEFSLNVTNAGNQKSTRQTIYQFHLIGKEGRNSVYECKLVKATIAENGSGPNGAVISLKTDSIRKIDFNNTSVFMPLALLNRLLKVTIDPTGKLVKIEGVTEALSEAADAWSAKDDFKKEMLANGVNYPANEIQLIFPPLPQQKLNIGKSWLNSEQKLNYGVVGKRGNRVTISNKYEQAENKASNQPKGSTKRTYIYNNTTNLLQRADIQHNYKFANGYVISENNSIDLHRQISKYNTDTAWFNMYMKLHTYNSTAFKKGVGYDTAKLKAYFKAHDDVYKNDKYYRTNRLQYIQWTSPFNVYSKELFATPNSFIAESQSHLVNKLFQIEKMSAAEAYDLTTYFYKMQRFDEWLQNSFGQNFTETRKPTEDDKKNQVLVNMYHQSTIEGLRQKTFAFTVWANARLNKDNSGYLAKSADSLMTMNGQAIDKANGNWYALMVYNMLLDVKKTETAEALVNKTISNLENNIADSAKYDAYRDKSLLAYAYYSKYLIAKTADSVKASQYLAKAALNSPTGKNYDAAQSYYDRIFLRNVKESYRDTFMDELFANKDMEKALDNFVKLLNSQPKNIAAMENSFKKYLPKDDFKSFFANKVVSTWQAAPAFLLKGINNKEYVTANYKNKWLVIDFWGTWCQPCRQEMPEINRFNASLTDTEHKGIQFLSIACNDTPDKVSAYLDLNKFSIPVAMADNQIERQFGINSYPSKVLIAPNGRMLALESGVNWMEIIEKFAKLYPAR